MNNIINSLTNLPTHYLSIDIEGNGYWDSRQDIVELSIVEILNDEVLSIQNFQFKPSVKINPIATKIHGITNDDISAKDNIGLCKSLLFDTLNNKNVLFHNCGTDIKLLNEKLGKLTFQTIIDTMKLSKLLLPNLRSYKLTELITHLNLEQQVKIIFDRFLEIDRKLPHNAPYDAVCSFTLLNELKRFANNQNTNAQGFLF